ncbi:hypothetical protein EJ05DRAFT_473213 [Pseudovirgaria hyperparasitica]|uniref:MARVEL domain-containing protein n=1 Tax=Pseudovirgaria hyperparasitica TaxID=470096 RepID=A0A6A6WK42_9PEZI|nr:uncharacterized protein EJ05DRAFT_473213 [Pseudovirgaria hyperparasitica]KAF2762301.1 hypothetical protein EJ05DRAFT_473213 [Pseudovirgaria hyperparasitica]
MAKLAGAALRIIQTLFYALAFCCAAIILGFYSYFLAVKADRDWVITNQEKAIEGMSGAAVLYTILAVLFTCCLGGVTFFAFLAIVLDVLFCGAFIAIAIMTRDATSCTGNVETPFGNGPSNSPSSGFDGDFGIGSNDTQTYAVSLGRACRYNQVCFAVAIIGAFLFAISAVVQLFLGRHHQREKRFGPSPANNYTAGSGNRKFWQRSSRPKTTHEARDAELATGGLAAGQPDMRPSHETGYTGSTVGNTAAYDSAGKPVNGAGGYHTGPATNY